MFSLRGRLILLLLAAFGALSGLIVWQSIEHRDERLSYASDQLLDHTRLIAARQQYIAAKADAILSGLMPRPELRAGAPAGACAQFLAALVKQEPAFIQASRMRLDGEVDCSAVPAAGRVSVADRNYFKSALRSRDMVISEVIMARITKQPVVAFAKAMHDESGHVIGVLVLSLDLTWLHRELAATRQQEGARLRVIDAKGTVAVRHPDPEGIAGTNVADQALFRHIAAAGEGMFEETGLDGQLRINAFVPLLETVSGPLSLSLSLPKAVVEAPVQRELWINLGFALGVLVATLGLVILGANRMLVRPLLTLARATARFSAGDLAARSGLPHTEDEIGRLARTLDQTAAAIEDREHKLAQANHALRVLSAGNGTLLRATGEQELLEGMCRAIVEAGGYRMAWVGLAMSDKRVRLVASWGAAVDFLAGLHLTWDETASGIGPTGTAIRRGIPVAANDILTDPDYAPWRERAQRYGYAASLALPLRL
ncbi:MAG: GAF domain-containing protein, partial [Rhodocyclales bacterium]|nr:GAF domain-containing protein [Rhodocyclales bacterium]